MKAELRTLGFDDSPFTRPDGRVPVVGVHMRGSHRIEGVIATDVARDTRRVRCGGAPPSAARGGYRARPARSEGRA